MKISNLSSVGVLTFVLAGCIAQDDHHDIDPAICDHHPGEYGCPGESSESSAPDAVSSSSAPVVVSSSSAPVVVSSSSAPVVVSSSSAPVVVVSSSSAPIVVSSSSAPAVSSSSVPAASSSAPAINIEDLSFSEALNEDQSIQTDSIANLGAALIGLIDKDAFDAFYLNLVAQGLDEAAINKAVSVLSPVGTAIGAHFAKELSGQDLLAAPEGINLVATVTPIGQFGFGVEYSYTVRQTIDDVDVALELALRFEDQEPSLKGFDDSANGGESGYNVYLSGLEVIVSEFKLSTTDVTIQLDAANPLLALNGQTVAKIGLTPDQSGITSVVFLGQALALNMQGSVVNGIIGVDANASGAIGLVNANIDMVGGSTTLDVTQPDITVNMQGVDTSN
jgi:hypothetical protein